MKKTLFLFLIITYNIFGQVSIDIFALQGVTIIDEKNQKPLTNQTILIKGQTIYQIFPTGSLKLADSIAIFNLNGKYVIPGLIDTHVHLATDPTDEPRSAVENILKKMLLAGVTSVRDMAGDARMLAGLSRDAFVGDINSPNIYYSALMAGTEFFKDGRTKASSKGGVNGNMPFMKAISDSTNFVLAIAEAKGTGATGIKLYEQLSSDLIKKVVDEATKQNIKVWAHAATFPAKPIEVVKAGVSVISHSEMLYFNKFPTKNSIPKEWENREKPDQSNEFWDEEIKKLNLDTLLNLMKMKGTILDATQSVYVPMIKKNPKLRWKGEISTRITKKAYQTGVKISTGTDTQELYVTEELKLLVRYCGFTPIDAIIAATRNGAEAIGILKTHGTIEVNKFADIIILNKNPLDDIRNIDAVDFVIKSGQIYRKK